MSGNAKMKTKKEGSFKKLILCAALVVCGIYASYAQKQRELEDIRQQCAETKLENAELERLLEQKDSADYLEKLARENLGYGYANEIFYIDISGN